MWLGLSLVALAPSEWEWKRTKFHPILGMDPNRSTELGKVRILPQNTFASERLARESSIEWIQIEALSWEKWEFFRKIPLLQNVRPGNVGNFVLEDPVTLTFDGCWFIIQINDISMKLYHVPIWHSSCYKNSTSQSVLTVHCTCSDQRVGWTQECDAMWRLVIKHQDN